MHLLVLRRWGVEVLQPILGCLRRILVMPPSRSLSDEGWATLWIYVRIYLLTEIRGLLAPAQKDLAKDLRAKQTLLQGELCVVVIREFDC